MQAVGERGVAEVDVAGIHADRAFANARSSEGRRAGRVGAAVAREHGHIRGGERDHGEPIGESRRADAGLEAIHHEARGVLAEPEGVVAARVEEPARIEDGVGDLDDADLRTDRAIQGQHRALPVAPDRSALPARLDGEAGRHLQGLPREVDHMAAIVGRVDPQVDALRGERDAVEAHDRHRRRRGVDRHPDRAGLRPKRDRRRHVDVGKCDADPPAVRGIAGEDILIQGRERDRRHILRRMPLRDGVVDLERVGLDPDVERILELHEPLHVDVEVARKRKQAAGTRPDLVRADREGEVRVVGDRLCGVDRRAVCRQVDVAHLHVRRREFHVGDAGDGKAAHGGVEQRPLAGGRPGGRRPLAEHAEGEVNVGSLEACPHAGVARVTDEGGGILDAEREGVDVDRRVTDERHIAAGRLEGEPALEIGKAEQGRVDGALRGERHSLHVERDSIGGGDVAKEDGCKRDGALRPIDRPTVAADHGGGVEHDRRVGDRGRKLVDAHEARERRLGLGRHPEAVGLEFGRHGEAEGRVLEREAHTVGRLAVHAEEQVGQGRGEREHRGVNLAAVVERERRVVGPHPHSNGLVDEVLDFQPGLALHVEEDLAADPDVEGGAGNARLDLVTERERGVEIGGVGGDQEFAGLVGEADVTADGEHTEEVGSDSLHVEGDGARGDRLGERVGGGAHPKRLILGDRCGGRRVLHEHPLGRDVGQVRDVCRQFRAGHFDHQLVVHEHHAEPTAGRQAGMVARGERGRHRFAEPADSAVGDAEPDVARQRHEVVDGGGKAGDRKGVARRLDAPGERVVESTGSDRAIARQRDAGRRKLDERGTDADVRQVRRLQSKATLGEFEGRTGCVGDEAESGPFDAQPAVLVVEVAGRKVVADSDEFTRHDGDRKIAGDRRESRHVRLKALDGEGDGARRDVRRERVGSSADREAAARRDRLARRRILHAGAVGRHAEKAGDRGVEATLDLERHARVAHDQTKRAVGGHRTHRPRGEGHVEIVAQGDQIAADLGEAERTGEGEHVGDSRLESRERKGNRVLRNRLGKRVGHARDGERVALGDSLIGGGVAEEDGVGLCLGQGRDLELKVFRRQFKGRLAAAHRQAEIAVAHRQAREAAAVERGRHVASDRSEPCAVTLESDVARERHEVGDTRLEALDGEGHGAFRDVLRKRVRRRAGVEFSTLRDRRLGGGVLGENAVGRNARESGDRRREPTREFEGGLGARCEETERGVLHIQMRRRIGSPELGRDSRAHGDDVRTLEADPDGAADRKPTLHGKGGRAGGAYDPALRAVGRECNARSRGSGRVGRQARLAACVVDDASVGGGKIERHSGFRQAARHAVDADKARRFAAPLDGHPAASRPIGNAPLRDQRSGNVHVVDGNADRGLRARPGAREAAEILAADREHIGRRGRAVGERDLLREALDGEAACGPQEATGDEFAVGDGHAERARFQCAERVARRVEREHHPRVVDVGGVVVDADLVGIERQVAREAR